MPGIKLTELSGIHLVIGTLIDKSNKGNEDNEINDGYERKLYDKTISTIDDNTFIFRGIKIRVNDNNLSNNNESNIPDTNLSQNNDKWMYSENYSTTIGSIKGITNKYDKKILSYANDYKLDPNIIKAIMIVESGGNPNATSHKNCRGLMQINAYYFNNVDLYNVDQNIKLGCKIFNDHLKKFDGDISKALLAYNRGEGKAKTAMKKGVIPENDDYIKNVQKFYKLLTQNNINITA